MGFEVCNISASKQSNIQLFFVTLNWILGFALGAGCASCSDLYFSSLMLRSLWRPMSIVGLVAMIFVPYLLTATAVYFHQFYLLIPVSFSKAFSFGFVSAFFKLILGNAHWITKSILMFSNIGCTMLLVALWYRIIYCGTGARKILYATGICFLIGLVDILVVAPVFFTTVIF